MPRLPLRALGALLAVFLAVAAPARGEGEVGRQSGFAGTALLCALAAEANGLSADAADWPGRARQAAWSLGDHALARAVPDSWYERTRELRQAAQALAMLDAAWQRVRAATGGPVAAADRALDVAAGLAVAAFALRLALRPGSGRRR